MVMVNKTIIIDVYFIYHGYLEHRDCWHQEFKCKNSECIRPAYLCDGETDCADGSDEENCDKSMRIYFIFFFI